jgi:hypothetical protein
MRSRGWDQRDPIGAKRRVEERWEEAGKIVA